MFDKKGRWWPSRLADKQVRKQWKTLYDAHGERHDGCPECTSCSGCYTCDEMRNLGREATR